MMAVPKRCFLKKHHHRFPWLEWEEFEGDVRWLKTHNLFRHEATDEHMTAGGDEKQTRAPSHAAFNVVLEQLRSGLSCDSRMCPENSEGIFGQAKAKTMGWCLVEALLIKHRKQLSECVVGSLLRDERHGRLQVRLRGATADMDQISMYIGTALEFSPDAVGINAATDRLLKTMCTRFKCCPVPGVEPLFDEALHKHVVNIIEALTVDAAANEVVAGWDLTIPNPVKEQPPLLPNCRFILRDCAHASRRVLQRPWQADPVTDNLVGMLTRWRGSLGQLINHSENLRQCYKKCTANADCAVTSSFQHLRCAQHRFETHVTPLSRIVLGLSAFFAFAVTLAESRKGTDQGRTATTFLDTVTPRMLILLGMLADAGIEALGLIRILDTEQMQTADLATHVQQFLERIWWLFHQGGCQKIRGHLKVVLQWLCTPHFFMYGSAVKSIGAVCKEADWQDDIDACCEHLRNWTVLAKDVMQAEFPDFSLLSSFGAFAMNTTEKICKRDEATAPQSLKQQLNRLEKAWGLDNFVEEYWEFHALASKTYLDNPAIGYLRAWQEAIQRGSRAYGRPAALVHVLQRFAAFSASTSGIEQSFSLVDRALPSHRLNSDARLDTESRLIALLLEPLSPGAASELCEAARELWQELHPTKQYRQHREPRIDKGIGRRQPPSECSGSSMVSEAQFLKRCRADIEAGTSAQDGSHLDGYVPEVWSEAHASEQAFQHNKRRSRLVEAMIEGTLVADDIEPGLEAAAVAEKKRRLASLVHRTKAGENLRDVLSAKPPTAGELRGRTVYIDLELLKRRPALSLALKGHACTHTSNKGLAETFVVEDVGDISPAIKMVASLRGAWIMMPAVFCMAPGAALKYHAGLASKRIVWVSDRFKHEHPDVWAVLRLVIDESHVHEHRRKMQWQLLGSADEWAKARVQFEGTHKSAVLALVSNAEKAATSAGNVLTLGGFLAYVGKLDRGRSTMGEAGM